MGEGNGETPICETADGFLETVRGEVSHGGEDEGLNREL
jgi:hypothetical protein